MEKLRLIDHIARSGVKLGTGADILGAAGLRNEGRGLRSYWVDRKGIDAMTDERAVELASSLGWRSNPLDPGVATSARRHLVDLDRLNDEQLGRQYIDAFQIQLDDDRRMSAAEILGVPVINADNVFAYMSLTDPKLEPESLLGVVIPPHERMFIEYDPDVRSHGSKGPAGNYIGVLLELIDKETADGLFDLQPKWVSPPHRYVRAQVIMQHAGEDPIGAIGDILYGVGADGRLTHATDKLALAPRGGVVRIVGYDVSDDIIESLTPTVEHALGVASLTVSFLHAKNITVREMDRPPVKKTRRGAKERPFERVGVIEFGKLQAVLDGEGRAGEVGLAKAMHFVRGHFKTYTAEKPLFGKIVGSYYWHERIAGDPEVGVVTREYKGAAVESLQETAQDMRSRPVGEKPGLGL